MIKLMLTLLCFNMMAYAGIATSTYEIASLRVGEQIVVGFVQSAPYYFASLKHKSCFQKALKSKSKVQIEYDYNSFEIQSCKVIK